MADPLVGPAEFRVTRLVFFPEIAQQTKVADEGVVRTGDVVALFYEHNVGRHVGVLGELVEAVLDVSLEVGSWKSVYKNLRVKNLYNRISPVI